MPDEISAFRGREEAQRDGDQVADLVKGPGARGPDERFQFREGQFDRIEIRAVGRQEAEVGTDGFDRRAHRGLFVDGEVVEHHHVARAQRGHQDLIDVGEKHRRVDRSVEHRRGPEAVEAQGRDDGVRLPMTAGRVITEAGTAPTAAVPAQQIRRHAAFIQKHILRHVAERLPGLPLAPGRGDIRPALLVGVYRFF
jgi:hypothetical protein